MSNAAMAWAFAQDLPSSDKFVLVAVADWAADREVFASVAAIARKTGLNGKTVRTAMQRLVASGHLVPTNERRGRTKQIIVYEISFSEDLFSAVLPAAKPPKNGSLPKTEASQNREGKDSQNWEGEDSQNRETDTKGDTKQENNNNRAQGEKENGAAVEAVPDGEDAPDVDGLTRQCRQLAGIHDVARGDGKPPPRWAQQKATVAGWLEAGADAGMILDVIEAGRAKATDGVYSLDYFDIAVRKRIAQAAADGVVRPERPPAEPELAEDADAVSRALKLRLREVMRQRRRSDATWCSWFAPCRFELTAGDVLLVRTQSAFTADWINRELFGDLKVLGKPVKVLAP